VYFTTGKFWADLTERAISTGAQSALGVVTAASFGLVELASWGAVATVAGTSALVAVLKAFAVGRGTEPEAKRPFTE
jgi:type IV secretory pathway TrbL component